MITAQDKNRGLTQEKQDSHLKNATKCIDCQSRSAVTGNFHCDADGMAWWEVECLECGCKWEQLFELYAVCNYYPRTR